MRILAVDDDSVFLEVLTRVLEPAGLSDVATCTSAKSALKLIADQPDAFDCFLLDVSMPGMDGISLCAEIRKFEGHKESPILMITASSDLAHIDKAFAAGATDYISKPLQGLELGSRIRVAMILKDQSRRLAMASMAADDRIDLTPQEAINCFDGELAIRNVPGIRDLQSLENDLLRLPQGSYNLAVFAVKVANADILFAEFGAKEFRQIMSKVARSISSKLDLSRSSFAYAGKGTFGASIFGRDVRTEVGRLQAALGRCQNIGVGADNTRTIRADILLAESKVSHMWDGRSAADALQRAVSQAETSAADLKRQERLDAQRLELPIKPRRHKIDFRRFCSGPT